MCCAARANSDPHRSRVPPASHMHCADSVAKPAVLDLMCVGGQARIKAAIRMRLVWLQTNCGWSLVRCRLGCTLEQGDCWLAVRVGRLLVFVVVCFV